MMQASMFFDGATLDGWLEEDIGYFDLTSTVLAIGEQPAQICWVARNDMVAACSEEVASLVQRSGGRVTQAQPSGSQIAAGAPIVTAEGSAQGLLNCWKVAQNLLEYACSVATRTKDMCLQAHQVNQHVGILTTRKHPPGLRRIAQKAALAGGAAPHRLGLSETVLVFPQHRALLSDGWQSVRAALECHKGRLIEKKIVIETETLDEAHKAMNAGADVIQFDKVSPQELKQWCPLLRGQWPGIKIIAAGGINLGNVQAYAASGVDALVTSSVYFGPPADIGVVVTPG